MRDDPDPLTNKPPAPDWFAAEARSEWDRVMPLLVERRILTDADMGSVESYCIASGQVRAMEAIIQTEGAVFMGDNGPRKHPAVAIQADAMTRARQLASELGLTPVSRSRPSMRDDNLEDDLSGLDA